jgi:hypothetical protein
MSQNSITDDLLMSAQFMIEKRISGARVERSGNQLLKTGPMIKTEEK